VKEAGWSPAEAIDAATLSAARLLRIDDRLGSLAEGKLADIIATRADPLRDVAALREIEFVMKGGRIHKRDGQPTAFI
jgi:imidazolonepropionase-like amidohydrolase